jgi:flagellar hook-associated protein 2
MTLVNFGSFKDVNGKSLANGLASGLDTKSIVDVAVAARKEPITKLQDSITASTKKIAAYSQLNQYLGAFKESVEGLRDRPSFSNSFSDIFNSKTTTIGPNGSTPGESYLSITPSATAINGNYSILVSAVAKAKIDQIGESGANAFPDLTSSVVQAAAGVTPGQFKAGTFQINGINITLAQGSNLNEVAGTINNYSDQTEVTASIIQVGTGDYRLILQSNETGTSNAFTINDPASILSLVTTSTTQAAADAGVTINGVTISSASNTITNVMGLDLEIYQPTGGVTLNATVSSDIQTIIDKVAAFKDSYNNLIAFIAEQTEKRSVQDANDPSLILYKYTENAALGGESIVTSLKNQITSEVHRAVAGVTGDYSMLTEIGISFIEIPAGTDTPAISNYMVLNEATLEDKLATNVEDVRKVFEFDSTSTYSGFKISARNNKSFIRPEDGNSITTFDIDLDNTRAAGNEVRVTYLDRNGNPVTINADYTVNAHGARITGQSGTVLEGVKIFYYGDGTDTATIDLSVGIAERLYNIIENAIAPSTGLIDNAVKIIEKNAKDTSVQIESMTIRLNEFRTNLIAKYSRVEEAISKVNNILMLLDAQARAAEAASK